MREGEEEKQLEGARAAGLLGLDKGFRVYSKRDGVTGEPRGAT